MSGAPKRGLTLKQGKIASDALKKAMLPPEDTVKPVGIVAREMFAAVPKPRAANTRKKVAAAAPSVKPKITTPGPEEEEEEDIPPPPAAPPPPGMRGIRAVNLLPGDEKPEPEPEAEAKEDLDLADILHSQEESSAILTSGMESLPPDQKEMAVLIQNEEKKDLYNTQIPKSYVPQSRRGFADFIKLAYKPYILPDGPITIPEGDKYYPYQKFVRDYMRKEAPYRGILVYHGLGSGKTCTAIAAAEALFATEKKNIIVMSPKSLKKNFLREVSKCGFRHFQLRNFWTKLPDPRSATSVFFATSVLGLSPRFIKSAPNIWVPDFRKSQAESNYDTLPPEQREEIRAQILSVVEYDPIKNPTGRIRFISYNGYSAKKLMRIACDTKYRKFFDNAVIVVDEIHNLIRMMRGNLEAYLVKQKEGIAKGVRRIPAEEITTDRWVPNEQICKKVREDEELERQPKYKKTEEQKEQERERKKFDIIYKRGYIFYRLLLDARNSKIIGLSGTPMINYPEELGILANVLHGFTPIIKGTIAQSGKAVQDRAIALGTNNPYVDFVEAKANKDGTAVTMSLLPAGTRKLNTNTGVTRIPSFLDSDFYVHLVAAVASLYAGSKTPTKQVLAEAIKQDYGAIKFPTPNDVDNIVDALQDRPSYRELVDAFDMKYSQALEPAAVAASIKQAFKDASLPFNGEMVLRAEPLLHAFEEDFKRDFIEKGNAIMNKATLITRLTGLVSYYKGSSLDLMPRVLKDEVVRVPFSDYAQKGYSVKRSAELKKEMEAKPGQKIDDVWKKIYELGDTADANNFMMGSRQTCNFVFPPDVGRPVPGRKDRMKEAAAGVVENELDAIVVDDKEEEKDETYELGLDVEGEDEDEEAEEEAGVQEGGDRDYDEDYEDEDEEDEDEDEDEDYEDEDNIMNEDDYEDLEQEGGMKGHLARIDALRAVPEDGEAATKPKTIAQLKEEKRQSVFNIRKEKLAASAAEAPPDAPPEAVTPVAKEETGLEEAEAIQRQSILTIAKKRQAAAKESADCKAATVHYMVDGKEDKKAYVKACEFALKCLKKGGARKRMTIGAEEGLSNYSAKFAAMIERINQAPGSSLVYSQFLSMEGIGIFRVAMEVNGFAPIEIEEVGGTIQFSKATEESLKRKQARYMTFSGGETDAIRAAALSIFNAQFSDLPDSMNIILKDAGYTDNKVGELCRVFCITSAGAEGLSLRNVRAVHIMEPYWNEVRLRQVKGRAIRIGSHLDLPEKDRNVSIYTYISCFSPDAQANKIKEKQIDQTIILNDSVDAKKAAELSLPIAQGNSSYVMTADEMIYVILERKRTIITALECILKSSSVDCEVNWKKNNDGTFMCLPLKGNIGDFLYNPILSEDLLNAPQFKGADGKNILDKVCVEGQMPQVPLVTDIFKKTGGVVYRLRPIVGEDGIVERFDMYEVDQADPTKKIPEKLVGTAAAKDGKPVPPIQKF